MFTPAARRTIWIAFAIVGVLSVASAAAYPFAKRAWFKPTPSTITDGATSNTATPTQDQPDQAQGPAVQTVQENLDIPWEVVFLPTAEPNTVGDILVTERAGRLLRIGAGGLLGLALHPDFARNNLLYLYLTTTSGDGLTNRVERYRLDGTTLQDRTVILEDIPGASNHDGGRLAFGPDKKLYVTTGDAGDPNNSQDRTSLAGKILRLNEDGSAAEDNPFDNAVYSYGHRNVQGITWDDRGRLWATEHGPSGACPNCGQDELNLVEPGKNYGWPTITGDATQEGLESPIAHSTVDETWAPSGIAFYPSAEKEKAGSLFFAGLRGESLYEAQLFGNRSVTLKAHFRSEFGRLRSVVLGPDGALYVLTNNMDGRGSPKTGDDKLLRIDPGQL